VVAFVIFSLPFLWFFRDRISPENVHLEVFGVQRFPWKAMAALMVGVAVLSLLLVVDGTFRRLPGYAIYASLSVLAWCAMLLPLLTVRWRCSVPDYALTWLTAVGVLSVPLFGMHAAVFVGDTEMDTGRFGSFVIILQAVLQMAIGGVALAVLLNVHGQPWPRPYQPPAAEGTASPSAGWLSALRRICGGRLASAIPGGAAQVGSPTTATILGAQLKSPTTTGGGAAEPWTPVYAAAAGNATSSAHYAPPSASAVGASTSPWPLSPAPVSLAPAGAVAVTLSPLHDESGVAAAASGVRPDQANIATVLQLEQQQRSPYDVAGFLSRLTFLWMQPLMRLGYSRPLEATDLPPLPWTLRAAQVLEALRAAREKLEARRLLRTTARSSGGVGRAGASVGVSAHPRVTLFQTIRAAFTKTVMAGMALKLSFDALQFLNPMLLNAIIVFIQNGAGSGTAAPSGDGRDPGAATGARATQAWEGFVYVGLMAAIALLQTAFLHQYFYAMFSLGQQLRTGVTLEIYRKALRLSLTTRQAQSLGTMVNLMSTDAKRLADLCSYGMTIVSGPFQILVAMLLLWQQIGVSVFGGLSVMLASLPINAWLARRGQKLQKALMTVKDSRVSATNESLTGIRMVKYSGWEGEFLQRIRALRDQELGRLFVYMLQQQVFTVLWTGLPLLVSLTSFGMYTGIHGAPPSAAAMFTSLSLFSLLRFPLSMIPNVINAVLEARVSLRRIQEFLDADEVDPTSCLRLPAAPTPSTPRRPAPAANAWSAGAADSAHISWHSTPGAADVSKWVTAGAWEAAPGATASALASNWSSDAANGSVGRWSNGNDAAAVAAVHVVNDAVPADSASDAEAAAAAASVPAGVALYASSASFTWQNPNAKPADDGEGKGKGKGKGGGTAAAGSKATKNVDKAGLLPSAATESDTSTIDIASSASVSTDGSTADGTAGPGSAIAAVPLAVRDATFALPAGSLTCVVGAVGSGKSSLIYALLGEMVRVRGLVAVRANSLAVAPQAPFILNATLRDNILFGLPYEQERYEAVLEACQLRQDLTLLPGGDACEIGEKGVGLSGGQSARVGLARAVYSRPDVILCDDVLAAVDAEVGRNIFERVFCGPLLAGCTRLLVTHGLQYVPGCAYVLVMDKGRVAEQGTPAELAQGERGRILQSMMATYQTDTLDTLAGAGTGVAGSEASDRLRSSSNSSAASAGSGAGERPRQGSATDVAAGERRPAAGSVGSSTGLSLRVPSTPSASGSSQAVVTRTAGVGAELQSSSGGPRKATPTATPAAAASSTGKQTSEEKRERGRVKLDVFLAYARATGGLLPGLVLAALFLGFQGISQASSVWLSYWSGHIGPDTPASTNFRYLGVYAVISVVSIVVLVVERWYSAVISLKASRRLHEGLVSTLLHVPLSFIDTTPLGRILNRCSQDVYTIDQQLMGTISSFISCVLSVLSTVVVISYTTPLFLLGVLPLGGFYLYVQRYYVATSRELQRLDSVSRSPIFANFSETLAGVTLIRAFRGAVGRFEAKNEALMNANQAAYYVNTSSNRWLAVRLETIGTIITTSSAFFAVLGAITSSADRTDPTFPALAGLSISMALSVVQVRFMAAAAAVSC
jgi:ABC-type multidrug transport system fused ATPase/permease subunit